MPEADDLSPTIAKFNLDFLISFSKFGKDRKVWEKIGRFWVKFPFSTSPQQGPTWRKSKS